ncbi:MULTISPECIES: hypothetical protein [unclassified Bradyrhizobium]|uniref:hypothetical protein n=1 Tax=unclassified Bradyrhizobium TaxID=2631580 RepID=UPI002916C128|nr:MULTISPECIES: hypothetical protein [unclassified Bradyrhizobium]
MSVPLLSIRRLALVALAAAFATGAWAQAPSTTAPKAAPAAKKPSGKAKPMAKPGAIESGPCRLGVISALGDQLAVSKFGLTVFETEEDEVTLPGWGLDDLAMARVRAATGGDPTVRRIGYPKGAFEVYYHPTSRFLPDPKESLTAIVRNITTNASCARYLVVTRFETTIPNTTLRLRGIGAYNQGVGSILRHSHLFANVNITLVDGQSYEKISSFSADTGARLAETMRLTEDPLNKLDNADFPEPLAAAASSTVLRERLRTLVAAKLDRDLPSYLKIE